MLLKGNPCQKYTVMATSCHEIIFHTSDSTSSFCFHSYFGGPFDIILTGSAVEKLVELHTSFYKGNGGYSKIADGE